MKWASYDPKIRKRPSVTFCVRFLYYGVITGVDF
jgi:hypothetical protein